MQEQGVRPDDPEFIKAHNLLTAIQRQQAYQKQQRMAQQQRQQQQMNGATPEAVPNGTHGRTASASSATAGTPQDTTSAR